MNSPETAWQTTQRIEGITSEYQLAWIRLTLIAIFFTTHYFVFSTQAEHTPQAVRYHQQLPWLCGCWCLVSLAVLACYHLKWMPSQSSYFVVLADIANLTVIASQNGGAFSSIVPVYFAIVTSAFLRINVSLVWFTTAFAIIAYLSLVGMADQIWFDENHAVPVSVTTTMVLSLASCGLIGWWGVRNTKQCVVIYQNLNTQIPSDSTKTGV
jgi:hypothetical protein